MSNGISREADNPYVQGFRAAVDGMKAALRSEEVGHAYLKIAAAIFALSVVIDAGAIWAVIANTAPEPEAAPWLVIVLWVARVLGIVLSLLIGPLVAVFVVNIAFPFFNQRVFLAGLKSIDPERAAILAGKRGMSIPRAAWIATVRLLAFLGLSLACFLIGLIPVIGTILGTIGQLWVTARAVAWELMDPYFDALDIGYGEQKQFVHGHTKQLLGFGLPVSLLLAIPFIGPLFFGLGQAATGMFVAREIAVDPRERVEGDQLEG